LLAGSGMAAAALASTAGSTAVGSTTPEPPAPGSSAVPFHGAHQSGIATPEQSRLVFAAYDLTTGDRAGLATLLGRWTGAAAQLASGATLDGVDGEFAPPTDTGEALGFPPSRLTLTIGFGPGLFDGRFGMAASRPGALVDLPPFAGDALDPARSGGDLCIQACADDAQVAFHAVHSLTRLAFGSATLRYLQIGFGRTASPGAGRQTPRNLLGFKDGTNNLVLTDQDAMERFVWVGRRVDQPWMTGGTYLVARRIRVHLEAWDRSTLDDQQRTIGRVKAGGAPLGAAHESDAVNLSALGPTGQPLIPAHAHIRVAAPGSNRGQAILRRGYSFIDGVDPDSGELDAGLFFICFQRDPRSQFIPIQQRQSEEDALAPYLLHTGSAVFACPPGIAAGQSWGTGWSERLPVPKVTCGTGPAALRQA
jgi:deferrochelatase/peroxidase EfeB